MQELADFFGWVGTTIEGRYRVDEVVGEGGFGVVYRGYHLGFDEAVAIKCLKLPTTMSTPQRETFLAAFIEEGRLLHRLSRASAGIVQALDVGASLSPTGVWTPYLVLEWLRGVPLNRDFEERRASGEPRRPLADAIALLAPAAMALDIAHRQGVAHRDVKPANLFLAEISDRPTLKVLDFGIAKVMSDFASTTQVMAETGNSVQAFTPQYGAPEQFNRSFGATGPWTDVFALALVLIEAASGRFALKGDDFVQLYVTATDRAHRPSLGYLGVPAPAAVEAVVQRALAVEPRERYRTAGEFWDALDRARKPTVPPSLYHNTALADTSPASPDQGIAPQAPIEAEPKTKRGAPDAHREDVARHPIRRPAQRIDRPPRVATPVADEPEIRLVHDAVRDTTSLSVPGLTPRTLAFDERGSLFVGFGMGVVLCLDLATRSPRWWQRVSSSVVCITVGAGWLAIGCGSGDIHLLNVSRRTIEKTIRGHSAAVRSMDMHRQAQTLVAGSDDKNVTLWSVPRGELLHHGMHPGRIRSVVFNGLGGLASAEDDETVRVWDAKLRPKRVLQIDGASARTLSSSPGGNYLAAGCDDGAIRLWDTAGWELKYRLIAHRMRVASMAFDPRGEIVVSGSSDGTVLVWEAASGRTLRVLGDYADAVECVAVSPDGRHVAASCTDGTVRVYRWSSAP
ncbi:serine/threonine-protein kinase [Sorangium cellulosum]|uniref:Protein kinase domain-containing protein n=1 Tax=Sorangium cellulosum So0157-2 TaxID=1254432 RepID=S4XML8_SORCE|nr:serine/threonine-protein kinase [Sorangium cellulosum]AGP33676.1 hypothetical protein SCE1572_03695 [Sorangium cellulosum So0157-2]